MSKEKLEVIVTGDIFRTNEKLFPNQLINASRMHGLIKNSMLAGAGIEPVLWFGSFGPFDEFTIPTEYYQALGCEASDCNWRATYFSKPTDELVSLIDEKLKGKIVICMEMSPLFQQCLDLNDICWIDLNIGPLRFLPDLTVSFKFSSHFNTKVLQEYFLDSYCIADAVERICDYYSMYSVSHKDSVIFFAQTEMDRSLLTKNGMFSLEDVFDKISLLLDDRKLLIKNHPYALITQPIITSLMNLFDAHLIQDNTYSLLSQCVDCDFATISSSVAHEARAFGKKVTVFNDTDWMYSDLISMHCYRDSGFWNTVLSQVYEFPDKIQPNYLREHFSYFSLEKSIWQQ